MLSSTEYNPALRLATRIIGLSSLLRTALASACNFLASISILNRLSGIGVLEAAACLAILKLSANTRADAEIATQLRTAGGCTVGIGHAAACDELLAFAVADILVPVRAWLGSRRSVVQASPGSLDRLRRVGVLEAAAGLAILELRSYS